MEFPAAFEARGLRMRPYQESDVPHLISALNDPQTVRFMSGTPGTVNIQTTTAWVHAQAVVSAQRPDRFGYAVADPATDELLAGAVLHVTRRRAGAEIGFWVCPAVRGRGVASTLTRALADLCIAQGVHRLELFIRPDNVLSQRVALAAGFRPEGELRDVLPGPGGTLRHNAILWSRLATDVVTVDSTGERKVLAQLAGSS
ncbi:GNAT family N-acetyltransferase [Streptomyces sp. NPDC058486]|uniref:GNAT family N-acetyltransferase n=1 Tax=unclassified Streptomyces TaxID=2593676 RepID=UPI0036586998